MTLKISRGKFSRLVERLESTSKLSGSGEWLARMSLVDDGALRSFSSVGESSGLISRVICESALVRIQEGVPLRAIAQQDRATALGG